MQQCAYVTNNDDVLYMSNNIYHFQARQSFTEGVCPNSYKSAIVTPILKKPNLDCDDPANY